MSEVNISLFSGGFLGMLAILFIALKLLDEIDWSWWWVLSPIWIPFAIIILILIGVVILLIIVAIVEALN